MHTTPGRPNSKASPVSAKRARSVVLRGQGPGLVNVLWAERKTTSFNLWAEAQNDKFLYMPRTHATATLVHQNYFGLVIGDATTTATTTRGHDHRRNDTRAVPSPELLMNTNLFT